MVSLEAQGGKWRWQYEREAPEGFTIHGHAAPRAHDGSVFAGFSDGYLVSLNGQNGEVMWAKGDKPGAEKVWRDALRDNPENDELQKVIKKYLR